jgi:hypothetical protein
MTEALIFIAILSGWYIANIVGTGDGFAAIHGRYDGHRKVNIFNGWIYKAADNLAPVGRLWGFWFMALRGLYKAPMIIALATISGNPIASLWALLCLFDGACYWLGGFPKEHKYSVAVAEVLSGALLGIMIVGVI